MAGFFGFYVVPFAATTFVGALLGTLASYGLVFTLLAPWMVLVAYPVAAAYVLAVGLPALFVLRALGIDGWGGYAVVGGIFGLVASLPQVSMIVGISGEGQLEFELIGRAVAWYLVIGVVCALSFRLVRLRMSGVA